MTLTETLNRSTNSLKLIVEIDITQLNIQWINNGAGIWECNAENVYSYVDSSLLDGFTAQDFGYIGSMQEDGVAMNNIPTLLELSSTPTSFYYDGANRSIYVHCTASDEPSLHRLLIGVVYPISYNNFIISGLNSQILGRLNSVPNVSISRDPLFYGRLSYEGGSVDIINSDGEFDTFGEDNNLYGNECRIKIGTADLSYSDWTTVLTKYIEGVEISESNMLLRLIDRRKLLSKRIRYDCAAKNAVTAIKEILTDYLGITYNTTNFDTDTWDAAEADATTATITMSDQESYINEEAIVVIQWLCVATFGIFYTTADNKFAIRILDTTSSAVESIYNRDIKGNNRIDYDPSEVITSVKVGYNRDWTDDSYTYYTDDTRETTIFNEYKVYREHEQKTVLPDLATATTYASTLLDQSQDVHGNFNIAVPLKYYTVQIGDIINVEIVRETTTMLGYRKCEVLGKIFDFDNLEIFLTCRVISTAATLLITESLEYITTEDNKLLVVE